MECSQENLLWSKSPSLGGCGAHELRKALEPFKLETWKCTRTTQNVLWSKSITGCGAHELRQDLCLLEVEHGMLTRTFLLVTTFSSVSSENSQHGPYQANCPQVHRRKGSSQAARHQGCS
jgi:hypothetical protein